jgi:hypothetical protein
VVQRRQRQPGRVSQSDVERVARRRGRRHLRKFLVPTGFTWTITGVFSNDAFGPFFGFNSTTANWQILSGVSAGNGGTVVASGDGADNITDTGMQSSAFGSLFPAEIYTNEVDGLNITLSAGTYWVAVAPDTDGAADAYWSVVTTSGANAVGTPPGNDGNSFFSSDLTGDYFTPTSDLEGAGTWDYSLGVVGTATPLVVAAPAPSAVTLAIGASLSLAAYGLLGFAYRRHRAVSLTGRA